MLLPSALPCDRPPLVRNPIYIPQSYTSQSPNRPSTIASSVLSTCRALQSLLNLQHPLSHSATPSTSPPKPASPTKMSKTQYTNIPKTQTSQAVCRAEISTRKRRRDTCESDERSEMEDQENVPQRCKFATPKRRRLAPVDLPFGLTSGDFFDLRPEAFHERRTRSRYGNTT